MRKFDLKGDLQVHDVLGSKLRGDNIKFLKDNLLSVRAFILKVISLLLSSIFQRDREYYYGRYFGTDNRLVLFVKNLVLPRRFLKKLMYGQIVQIPSLLSLSRRAEDLPELSEEWEEKLEILRRDGILFLPGYFADRAVAIREKYQLTRKNFPSSDQYYRFSRGISDTDIYTVITDAMMLAVIANYYGCQPYHRHEPGINCTHADARVPLTNGGFNDFWHYDTANQMTAHILLNDVSASDNCMLYAKGSHRVHREYITKNDYYYSEEYMRDTFDLVPCIGETGTLIIFDPNGLHRVDLKPATFRSHLHLNFVPGNDLLKVSDEVKKEKAKIKDRLLELKKFQAESLAHLIGD